ncbi:DUF4959 domain-containing protein [Neotamlana laminarinivorans]|uniref:DUF4959 domain-containing protein n=1 Tax=Neotamlana laminarinivorans TaxID=2883124 RepID=A0A9X1I0N9_9FLAO|nr:DUF4959 domain-containing protein [Tamlana laminarinivorans]MCB4799654.1 DUF4959 domain-containing protein [Tamlana laminarinivorans]
MKNLKLLTLFMSFALILSCEEDNTESLVANDGVAPGMVTVEANAVENFSGGSKITYNLPDDDDLLYVVAEYQRASNGEVVSVKSSAFNNSLTVEGFANAEEYNVNLYAVDQSENRSAPTMVTISPEAPPYTFVCETVYAEATYGGIQLFWENPETGLVTIEVYIEDASGNLIFKDAIYTEGPTGQRLVLGLDAVETNFVIIVRDRYNNRCPEIRTTLTPLYIQLFDRANYQAVYQKHDTPDAYGWILPNLYNGSSGGNGFHTPPGWVDPDGELPEYADWSYDGIDMYPTMFTIDIGELVQLYRFKYWPRLSNYMWRHGNPHLFDLWGTDELNADGTFDGWTLLLENVGPVKPSGTLSNDDNTTEDEEAATAGFNFEISPDMPKVRYIRFVQKVNQDRKSTLLHLTEVEFYGDNR